MDAFSSKVAYFPHPNLVWHNDAPSGGTPRDINVIYRPLWMSCNNSDAAGQYGCVFIRLAVVVSKCAKSRENSSERIRTYSRSCPTNVNRTTKAHWDFLLVINSNFGRLSYRFREILTLKNGLFFHLSLVCRPARENPLEFLDETLRQITRWMGLGWNCIILTSTILSDSLCESQSDRQTDGRPVAIALCKCRALNWNDFHFHTITGCKISQGLG